MCELTSELLFKHTFNRLQHGKLLRAGLELEHLDELVLAVAFQRGSVGCDRGMFKRKEMRDDEGR